MKPPDAVPVANSVSDEEVPGSGSRMGVGDAGAGSSVWRARTAEATVEWPAPAARDLVSSAQQAGWRLPRSCRNGTCRACLCRLIEGRVAYRVDWPGLSADEHAEGWILPCVALPRSDVVIDVQVEPLGSADSGASSRPR